MQQSTVNIANNVRTQLFLTQQVSNQGGHLGVDLVRAWGEWFPDMMNFQAVRTLHWVLQQILPMRAVWLLRTADQRTLCVLSDLWVFEQYAGALISFLSHGLAG